MGSLSFFTSEGGELLYSFFYLGACLIVIFMLSYEWQRTNTRDKLYLLYAFVVMLANLIFINLSLAQEVFFGATRSYFWFPIITWNLQALSLIFLTGAFIYPVAHQIVWLKKYLSYNIILLVFSFCIVTPLWLNSYFMLPDYNQFWGAYYYAIWLCLILVLTIFYMHFYAAEYYSDWFLRAFMGILLFNQVIHLWRIVSPQSYFIDYLIIMERSLPLVASFILVLTIYKSIVSSLIEANKKLGITRRKLDLSNQELEKKVIVRTGELSETNKELLRFKEFHENIQESLTDGILVVGSDSRIMAINRAAQVNLKLKSRSVKGRVLRQVLPPPKGVKWQELIQEVMRTDQETRLDKMRCKLPQLQEEIVVNLLIQPLKDKELNKIGAVLAVEFITETVELESKIKRTEKLAYMGKIAAGVAHEIRNPLNSISINLQLLRRALLRDKNAPNHSLIARLKVADTEISRLDGIIKEFIQFARPKKTKLQKRNINQVIEEIINLIEEQAFLAHVSLVKDLDCQIPPIPLDDAQIRQVFLNIGINSMQAMSQGGCLTFKTRLIQQNAAPSKVCVSIIDKGRGMSELEQKKAFEPFYSTKEDGTGLGLAIAQYIIEEHNGSINLQSKPGTGSTFTIILPVARPN